MAQQQRPPGWYDDGHGQIRWWSGRGWTTYRQPDAPQAFSSNSYCVPERSGDSFVTENQNACTFGGGLDVSSLIGIDLTAKTGWSNKTVVTFKFSKSMQLCGASGRPGADARRLKAIP